MTSKQRPDDQEISELQRLITAVIDYGEQARLLALNLAAAAANAKTSGRVKKQVDDDLFSLVTRMSTVARQVTEIANAARSGIDTERVSESDRLLRSLLDKGVFNAEVIHHLERSLNEALTLTQKIADHLGLPAESLREHLPQRDQSH